MKKLFLSVLACTITIFAFSCSKKAEKAESSTTTRTQTEVRNEEPGTGSNTNTTSEKTDSCVTVATVASEPESPIGTTASPSNETANIDTLSYIVGMDMGSRIEMDIIPMFKVDYSTMMSIFEQALDPNATINIEGEQFNMENYREIGDKYITKSDLRTRVMAAQNDSTAQIYKDEKEKKIVSAILGADFAYSVSNLNMGLDNATLKKAILDVHEGKKLFTDEFAMEYTRNYFTVVIPQQNKKESEKWLAEIEKQEGVKKTASGILYKIENAGDASIKATKDQDVVKVLYTGRTKDGKVFDSNRWNDMPSNRQEMIKTYQPDQAEKNNPIEFPLDRVIKGWTEGMKLIGKGGRIILWIPSSLAYGERGTGQDIGPNEALCFDVELLDVTSK